MRLPSAAALAPGLALLLVITPASRASSAPRAQLPEIVDATATSGLEFTHAHGGAGERYMVETMGSGLALGDFDLDGWLDAYLAQGAATPGARIDEPLRNVLLRGAPPGRFVRAPDTAGVGSERWSMGVAAADFDADGFDDLYVSNFGVNQLYRNNGDGTFTEVGAAAGVDDPLWGASVAWADIDNDGNLDLYVTNYVDFAWDNHKFCGDPRRNLRAYCHPDVYEAQADRLFRSHGDGTFTDIAARAGVADTLDGKGLGVVFGDYNDDGRIDIYVANDSTKNFLYTNVDGTVFVEDGLLAGVSYSSDGQAEAGMGTDWGDIDGDGRIDVVVTNLDLETNSLYRNLGEGSFADVTFASGIGEPSLLQVGFGTNWIDFDHDADLDLFVANGHIIDNIAELRDNIQYAQLDQLYVNDGSGSFDAEAARGSALERSTVARGSAIGDVDNDGDIDIVVSNNNEPASYWRNDGGAASGNWIQLRLVGTSVNRSAVGARVLVQRPSAPAPLLREVRAGSSYCSSSDLRVHVGLGPVAAVDVEILWPNGAREPLAGLAANAFYVVQQGRGVIATRASGR